MDKLTTLLIFNDLSQKKIENIISSLEEKTIKSFKEKYPFEYNYCINNIKYYQNNHFCSIR